MSPPLAYFLSWTCYGTRLHGDERGSVDREHDQVGTPYLASDPKRREREREAMRWAPIKLSRPMRQVVRRTIVDHCRIRGWRISALNVRTTHVHIVVTARAIEPEPVMEQFKAWATRRLREAGLVDRERKVWTEHGSTKWVNNREGLAGAIHYVLYEQ